MPQITHYKTPCPEQVNSQILQMVVDNLTDISMVAIAPSNLLYNVYQYAIGYEVHLYLEALNGAKGIAVELIVATDLDDPDKVVGFLLYLPVKDDPDACSVAYMAVDAGHRRQGVARRMLREMVGRYPHAELTCAVAKVPYFESMGFQVVGVRAHPGADEHPRSRQRRLDGAAGCGADLQLAGGAADSYLPAAKARQAGDGRCGEAA